MFLFLTFYWHLLIRTFGREKDALFSMWVPLLGIRLSDNSIATVLGQDPEQGDWKKSCFHNSSHQDYTTTQIKITQQQKVININLEDWGVDQIWSLPLQSVIRTTSTEQQLFSPSSEVSVYLLLYCCYLVHVVFI